MITELVRELLDGGATWTNRDGETAPITLEDIVIVAPYNAHVERISRVLADAGLATDRVGTVDKFQGQEAPISIYSMATPTPEEAPRGMEFLYSLNRLNVATSRAKGVAARGRLAGARPGDLPHAAPDAARECAVPVRRGGRGAIAAPTAEAAEPVRRPGRAAQLAGRKFVTR